MANGQERGDPTIISSINVTPLVDVVLVLLVILMVTAGYIVARSIPVDLPTGATGESTAAALAITIDSERREDAPGERRATTSTWPSASSAVSAKSHARSTPSWRLGSTSTTATNAAIC